MAAKLTPARLEALRLAEAHADLCVWGIARNADAHESFTAEADPGSDRIDGSWKPALRWLLANGYLTATKLGDRHGPSRVTLSDAGDAALTAVDGPRCIRERRPNVDEPFGPDLDPVHHLYAGGVRGEDAAIACDPDDMIVLPPAPERRQPDCPACLKLVGS